MSLEKDFDQVYANLKSSIQNVEQASYLTDLKEEADLNGHTVLKLRDYYTIPIIGIIISWVRAFLFHPPCYATRLYEADQYFVKLTDQVLEHPKQCTTKTLKRMVKYNNKSCDLHAKLSLKTPQADLFYFQNRSQPQTLPERVQHTFESLKFDLSHHISTEQGACIPPKVNKIAELAECAPFLFDATYQAKLKEISSYQTTFAKAQAILANRTPIPIKAFCRIVESFIAQRQSISEVTLKKISDLLAIAHFQHHFPEYYKTLTTAQPKLELLFELNRSPQDFSGIARALKKNQDWKFSGLLQKLPPEQVWRLLEAVSTSDTIHERQWIMEEILSSSNFNPIMHKEIYNYLTKPSTPLHIRKDFMQMLLEKKDISLLNRYELLLGSDQAIRVFVLKGMENRSTGWLERAVILGADFSRLTIEYNGKKRTPLSIALELNSFSAVQYILKTNIKLATTALETGTLPFESALEWSCSVEIIDLLLDHHVDPYQCLKDFEKLGTILVLNRNYSSVICKKIVKKLLDLLPNPNSLPSDQSKIEQFEHSISFLISSLVIMGFDYSEAITKFKSYKLKISFLNLLLKSKSPLDNNEISVIVSKIFDYIKIDLEYFMNQAVIHFIDNQAILQIIKQRLRQLRNDSYSLSFMKALHTIVHNRQNDPAFASRIYNDFLIDFYTIQIRLISDEIKSAKSINKFEKVKLWLRISIRHNDTVIINDIFKHLPNLKNDPLDGQDPPLIYAIRMNFLAVLHLFNNNLTLQNANQFSFFVKRAIEEKKQAIKQAKPKHVQAVQETIQYVMKTLYSNEIKSSEFTDLKHIRNLLGFVTKVIANLREALKVEDLEKTFPDEFKQFSNRLEINKKNLEKLNIVLNLLECFEPSEVTKEKYEEKFTDAFAKNIAAGFVLSRHEIAPRLKAHLIVAAVFARILKSFPLEEQKQWALLLLEMGIRFENVELIQQSLEEGSVTVNSNNNGVPAILFAVDLGKVKSVRFLLDKGANPNVEVGNVLLTPLLDAAQKKHYWEIATDLLRAGACDAVFDRNIVELVLQSTAAQAIKIAFLKTLFKNYPLVLNLLDLSPDDLSEQLRAYLISDQQSLRQHDNASILEICVWMGFENTAQILAQMSDYEIAKDLNQLINKRGISEKIIQQLLAKFFEIDAAHYRVKVAYLEWGMVDGEELKNDLSHLVDKTTLQKGDIQNYKTLLHDLVDKIFLKKLPFSESQPQNENDSQQKLYDSIRPDLILQKCVEMLRRLSGNPVLLNLWLQPLTQIKTLEDLLSYRLKLLRLQFFNHLNDLKGKISNQDGQFAQSLQVILEKAFKNQIPSGEPFQPIVPLDEQKKAFYNNLNTITLLQNISDLLLVLPHVALQCEFYKKIVLPGPTKEKWHVLQEEIQQAYFKCHCEDALNPGHPDSIDLDAVTAGEDVSFTPEKFKKKIRKIIARVYQRTPHTGTPPPETEALEKFYAKLQGMLVAVSVLTHEQKNKDIRNYVLTELALKGKMCATAWFGCAYQLWAMLKKGGTPRNFEDIIYGGLAGERSSILNTLIDDDIDEAYHVHEHHFIHGAVGKHVGAPNAELLDNMDSLYERILEENNRSVASVLKQFKTLYTAFRGAQWILQKLNSRDKEMKEIFDAWRNENLPEMMNGVNYTQIRNNVLKAQEDGKSTEEIEKIMKPIPLMRGKTPITSIDLHRKEEFTEVVLGTNLNLYQWGYVIYILLKKNIFQRKVVDIESDDEDDE